MTFQPGHPPYRRRSNLAVVEAIEELPPLPDIRRWQPADFDEWLLTRLVDRWEGSEPMWRSKFAGFSASNDFLLITNEEAVLMAWTFRDVMTNKAVVMERFAFAREASLNQDEVYRLPVERGIGAVALRALYRQMREWGKSLGATRVYTGICSDLNPARLLDMVKDSYYVVGSPCT